MAPAAKQDGRQLRWEKHREERRRVVIEAAIAVLEERGPGETFHVQDIADRSGMHRTVIYRHFTDRTDLDLAVQQAICDSSSAVMLAAVQTDGNAREIISSIIGAYVRWAVDHPALVTFVERDLAGSGDTPFKRAVRDFADVIELLISNIVAALGEPLDQDSRDLLDPMVFGMIGGVFQATQRWLTRDVRTPAIDVVIREASSLVWHQINGLATDRGITVPDAPVGSLLARVIDPTA